MPDEDEEPSFQYESTTLKKKTEQATSAVEAGPLNLKVGTVADASGGSCLGQGAHGRRPSG